MSETCSVCGGIQLPSGGFYHEEFCWHNKRSVLDISDWPGWEKFLVIYRRYEDAKNPYDCRLYFLTLFNGGFRRKEATLIRRDMIAFNDEALVIYNAPVHKKKNKTTRNIVIPLDEEKNPLALEFLDVIEDRQTEFLLPAKLPFGMGDMDIGSASSKTVYNRMRDMKTFPHAIRAYRAMHLVAVRKFTPQDLMGWFDWSNASMALHYTRTRRMADRLGVENLPPLS